MDTEKSNQSIISFAFVVCGFLAFFVTSELLDVFSGIIPAVARIRNVEWIQHGLPVTAGIATFLILFLNKKIHTFADEAVIEVRKVVWPSKKDTISMTIVCCVMVIMAGVAFGVFDFFASHLMKMFVG